MPWIESHTSLARHPKTIRLAKTLDISVPCAIGHLHLLWWWSLEYAQEGDLSGFDPEEVAEAAGYDGDGEAFVSALKRARFVDDDGQLHDWQDYAGRLLEKRRTDAERLRRWRAEHRDETPPPSFKSDGETRFDQSTNAVTVPNRTVPNQTKQNLTESTVADATAPTPIKSARSLLKITDEYVEELIVEYAPRLGGEHKARDAVAAALNHTAMDKAKDKRLYLVRWLNRDVERCEERRNGTGHGTAGQPFGRHSGTGTYTQRSTEAATAGVPSPFAKYV